MDKRKWPSSQLEAIAADDNNILLSAAAGSGKTATLTQRIIRAVCDSSICADPTRLLVVTFTNDAAAELRDRIGAALESAVSEARGSEKKRLAACLSALDGAPISTIHSFLLSELRPRSGELGLPPDFQLLEEAEALVLKKEIMLDTVNDFFDGAVTESKTSDSDNESANGLGADAAPFSLLSDTLSGARDEGSLDQSILSIRDGLCRLGLSAADLRRTALDNASHASGGFMDTAFAEPVKWRLRLVGEHYEKLFSYYAAELSKNEDTARCRETAELDGHAASKLLRAAGLCDADAAAELKSALDTPSLSPLKKELSTDIYEDYKSARADFKKEVRGFVQNYFASPAQTMERVIRQNAALNLTAAQVVEEFEKRYSAAKRERGRCDFSDIETLALSIFTDSDGNPTDAARECAARYDAVFIDEYQDVNTVQEKLFSALFSNTPRFMVGDVKQSIYGFRGACPRIFNEYREGYRQHKKDGRAIFMSENFRSDGAVIDFSNLVSGYIFPAGDTPYSPEDRLICAKSDGRETPAPVEICLVSTPSQNDGNEENEGEDKADIREAEAGYVASRIRHMVDSEGFSPGDVAVLLRSGARAQDFAAAIEAAGVPVKNRAAEEFFDQAEVKLMLCILGSADNPLRDIYLAGAMKSPIGGFSLDDLVNIKAGDKDPLWYCVRDYSESGSVPRLREKCKSFADRLGLWRGWSAQLDAAEAFERLLDDTGLMYCPDFEERSAAQVRRSMRILSDAAVKCAADGGGISDLLAYLGGLMEKKDRDAHASGADNAVTVTTIHKSKGLQYKVCFISDSSRRFNLTQRDRAVLSEKGGLAMRLYDSSGLVRCSNPLLKGAGAEAVRAGIFEEMRVLYVAMTRAEKRLIITCAANDAPGEIEKYRRAAKLPYSAYSVINSKNYMEWILAAACADMGNAAFTVRTDIFDPEAAQQQDIDRQEAQEDAALTKLLRGRLSKVYGHAYLENIPAKLSVSKLSPDILDSAGMRETSAVGTVFESPAPPLMEKSAPMPIFMGNGKSAADMAAEKGVATHLYLQFCNFENLLENGAAAELQRLRDSAFLTAAQAEQVRLDEIEFFRSSSLLAQISEAERLYREQRFNASLPAWRFTEEPVLRETLLRDKVRITVQGVVDCMFISKGQAVLVDYKTDRLTESELSDKNLAQSTLCRRHSRQLRIYADVCSEMLGQRFDKVYIYSLPLGDTVEVDISDEEGGGYTDE